MINIVDSISAINNSFDCDKDYEEKIMMFLDRFLEKLRNLNQKFFIIQKPKSKVAI